MLAVSPEIIAKYQEVLSRPSFGLPVDIWKSWSDMLDALTICCNSEHELDFPRDQKDARLLACAVSATADYLARQRLPGSEITM